MQRKFKVGDRIRLKSFPTQWTNPRWRHAVNHEFIILYIDSNIIRMKCTQKIIGIDHYNNDPELSFFDIRTLDFCELVEEDYMGWPCYL